MKNILYTIILSFLFSFVSWGGDETPFDVYSLIKDYDELDICYPDKITVYDKYKISFDEKIGENLIECPSCVLIFSMTFSEKDIVTDYRNDVRIKGERVWKNHDGLPAILLAGTNFINLRKIEKYYGYSRSQVWWGDKYIREDNGSYIDVGNRSISQPRPHDYLTVNGDEFNCYRYEGSFRELNINAWIKNNH